MAHHHDFSSMTFDRLNPIVPAGHSPLVLLVQMPLQPVEILTITLKPLHSKSMESKQPQSTLNGMRSMTPFADLTPMKTLQPNMEPGVT
jgi:hypothetical protein